LFFLLFASSTLGGSALITPELHNYPISARFNFDNVNKTTVTAGYTPDSFFLVIE